MDTTNESGIENEGTQATEQVVEQQQPTEGGQEAAGLEGEDLSMSDDEGAALGAEDQGTQVASAPTGVEVAGSGERTPPAYEAFIAAVQAHATTLSLSVKEQKGFFQFSWPKTGHRLYVAKQGRAVQRVDTTLPRTVLTVNGTDISLPLSKPNGRIQCHVDPTVESVCTALSVLASYDVAIDPPRKAIKTA